MSSVHSRVPLWAANDAAAATNGRLAGAAGSSWLATGVSIDSRTVAPGDLFVALKGPSFDGHDFVAAAIGGGAAAAMVSRVPPGVPPEAPLLVVEDVMAALEDLGRVARLRSRARIIAITGSVGKTSTKEALAAGLAAQAVTYASAGNLNNQWGVPLSLARLPESAAFGIFELGMNHAGEIGPLSRQVSPDVAVITTVAPAHLEFFPSVAAIADAKAEIFEGMTPNGTAILPRDNPHFARLLAAARTQGLAKVLSFGAHEGAEARLLDCSLHATSSAVTAVIKGERLQYCLSLPGRHQVINSLGVLLAVRAAGGDVVAAARAFAQLAPLKGRGTPRRVALPRGAFSLLDESYNASPAAVEAALAVLAKTDPGAGGRRVAVLGDMLELGASAPRLHAALAAPLKAAGVDVVFCCGPLMRHLFDHLPAAMRGGYAPDSAELAGPVAEAVRPGDVVLVKGSLGSGMARVVEALVALDTGAGASPMAARAKAPEAAKSAKTAKGS